LKAIIQEGYGGPDSLNLREINKPSPKKNEVLVKVKAAAINDYDWCLLSGKP